MDIVQRLLDSLEDDEYYSEHHGIHTCCYDYKVLEDGSVNVWLRIEQDKVFEGLKSHLTANKALWESFDEYKRSLSTNMKTTTENPKVGVLEWLSHPDASPKDAADVPKWGTVLDFAPTSRDALVEQLELVRMKGITTGKCDLCPDE